MKNDIKDDIEIIAGGAFERLSLANREAASAGSRRTVRLSEMRSEYNDVLVILKASSTVRRKCYERAERMLSGLGLDVRIGQPFAPLFTFSMTENGREAVPGNVPREISDLVTLAMWAEMNSPERTTFIFDDPLCSMGEKARKGFLGSVVEPLRGRGNKFVVTAPEDLAKDFGEL